jgi:6-phosphogluconolactonase
MNSFAYVSHHESGDIAAFALAADTGRLAPRPRVAASRLVMPMAASPDGRFLHAAVRAEPFEVLTCAIDRTTGDLRRIASTPLPESMVGIAVDRSGRWLLAAAYGADALFVFPIDAQGCVVAAPVHRQPSGGVKPHAICLDAANRFVYVPHLGTDEVRIYAFDAATGGLTPCAPASAKVKPGAGPRHLVLSRDERFLYVLGQLDGSVTVFRRDPDSGALDAVQSIDSVPPGSGLLPGRPRPPTGSAQALPPETDVVWCADIQITPQGHFVYTTERAKSTISILAVDPASGHLRFAGHVATEQQPRAIAIDPQGRFLVASGEASQEVAVYAIDGDSGALRLRHKAPTGAGANWVLFVAPTAS